MPGTALLDPPGLLRLVMIRGIERRDVFTDDGDRENLIERFSGFKHNRYPHHTLTRPRPRAGSGWMLQPPRRNPLRPLPPVRPRMTGVMRPDLH